MDLTVMERLYEVDGLSDPDTWVRIIEEKVKEIAPCLDTFSLSTIGSVELPKNTSKGGVAHSIDADNPEMMTVTRGAVHLSLKTQGIFAHTPISEEGDGSSFYIYGLTRRGTWIRATVEYERRFHLNWPKSFHHYTARCVLIEESSIYNIVKTCLTEKGLPRYDLLFTLLNEAVFEWHRKAAKRYRTTSALRRLAKQQAEAMRTKLP